ncbi:MAG: glycosyltransferase family 1 protein [Lentisphaerota bacterium]
MCKKILIVTDNLQDQINGVVTTFKNVESHASDNGYSVVYLDPGQFPHRDCPGYPEVKLSWPWGISKKIKAIQPDYIHIATEGPVGLFARWWCERNNVPYNTSYHTDFPKFLKTMYRIPARWTYWYLRWFHKNSHRVLVTTETIRKDLEAHGFQNLVVWSRGVDRTIKPSFKGPRKRKRPMVLSVGRVSAEKGLDQLVNLQDDYLLVIVGDGPYMSRARELLPRAKFLGYQQGQALVDWYYQADVFVFPSQADTFGLVIVEAMARGTPVAAFPVAGPIDIIEQGVNGYMSWDLPYAVNQCLKLDRKQVKKASKQWSWEHCWKIFKDNLITIQH